MTRVCVWFCFLAPNFALVLSYAYVAGNNKIYVQNPRPPANNYDNSFIAILMCHRVHARTDVRHMTRLVVQLWRCCYCTVINYYCSCMLRVSSVNINLDCDSHLAVSNDTSPACALDQNMCFLNFVHTIGRVLCITQCTDQTIITAQPKRCSQGDHALSRQVEYPQDS